MFKQDWNNETCCIIASGPSLILCDATYARAHADRVIVINESWRMCPSADLLYGADEEWWMHRAPTAEAFTGERWSIDLVKTGKLPSNVRAVNGEFSKTVNLSGPITTGMNSAFQSMQIAMRRGCRKIIFLGLDLTNNGTQAHWHGNHEGNLRNPSDGLLGRFRECFETAAPILAENGYEVINASRETALECFPRMSIQDAIQKS